MSSNKEKQRLYIKYLSQGLESRQAMKKAGYTDNSIKIRHKQIHENALKNYDIKELSSEIVENQLKNGIPLKPLNVKTPSELLEWWSSIIDDNNVRLDYRLKVSEYIAKCHGMFINKLEVTTNNYSQIIEQARTRMLDVTTVDNDIGNNADCNNIQ